MIRPLTLIATATLALGMSACAPATDSPAPTTWSAVVEWSNGHSDIVEHGATLSDCMQSLERFDTDTRAIVTYCEKESAQ